MLRLTSSTGELVVSTSSKVFCSSPCFFLGASF
ncbi:hypothetical protein BSTP3_001 [Bacillus phage BSTP3]|nr:hypothetical protein BSTP3_001 [Bacillus phage BSTP3]